MMAPMDFMGAVTALGRWIDEAFVGFSLRARLRDPEEKARLVTRLAEAAAYYEQSPQREAIWTAPPPIDPRIEAVGGLDAGRILELRWPSGYAAQHESYRDTLARYPESQTVHARWYRHDQPHPAVIVLHGWGSGFYPVDAVVFRARWLYHQGLDVVMVQAPFHAHRARLERLVPPMFPSYSKPVRTIEGVAQWISDSRAAAAHVLAAGAPAVGALGMSFGGFSTALLATAEPALSFAVATIPFANISDLAFGVGEDGRGPMVEEALGVDREGFARAFAAVDPLLRPPAMDPRGFAIVYGTEDRMTPPAHADLLHAHFPGSRMVPFPGSHLVQVGRQLMFDTVVALSRERRPG